MDNLIQISKINDFIFCPYSIFLHEIYSSFHQNLYHDMPQKAGKITHEKIDKNLYSSRKNLLQGKTVVSLRFGLIGKIDIYDAEKKMLIERKREVKKIYDGYRYQLYAQYFGLKEAGCEILKLRIHSLVDNRNYDFDTPSPAETREFENVIEKIKNYTIDESEASISPEKCKNCIYRSLCAKSTC